MPVVPEYAPFNSSRERRGFDAELLSNGACILRCLRALGSWLNHREKALRVEFIRSTLNYTDCQAPRTTCVKGDNVGFPNGCFLKTFTGLQSDHLKTQWCSSITCSSDRFFRRLYNLYRTGIGADRKQHQGQCIGLRLCILWSSFPGGSVYMSQLLFHPLLPSNLFAFLAVRFTKSFRPAPGM